MHPRPLSRKCQILVNSQSIRLNDCLPKLNESDTRGTAAKTLMIEFPNAVTVGESFCQVVMLVKVATQRPEMVFGRVGNLVLQRGKPVNKFHVMFLQRFYRILDLFWSGVVCGTKERHPAGVS